MYVAVSQLMASSFLQIIVNSMHRYQPRLHIVESDDINSFNWDTRQTFIFPGTQFTTVTAYQNDKVCGSLFISFSPLSLSLTL